LFLFSALKTLWSQWNRLEIIGGILFRKFESNDGQSTIKQMIVPQSKKQDILHYFHDIPRILLTMLLDSPLIPLCVGTQQEAAVFPVIFHPPVGDWLYLLI
jgi:hypothetical protein